MILLSAKKSMNFAAVVPICGKGDPAQAKLIKDLPIWVFHGAKEPVVPNAIPRIWWVRLKSAAAM